MSGPTVEEEMLLHWNSWVDTPEQASNYTGPLPESAVELAARAAWDKSREGLNGWPSWDDAEADDRRRYREIIRAALPAIREAVVGEYRELVEAANDVPVEYDFHGKPSSPELARFVAALAALTEQENRNG